MKRLLTIGHSYVVGLNRRLAHEMALQGRERWTVTAAAPAEYPGDLRTITLEPIANEACRVVPLRTRLARSPHVMTYRGLRPLLHEGWDVVHCWEEPYVAAAAQIAQGAPLDAAFVFSTFQNIAKTYPFPFGRMEKSVLARANGWIAFGVSIHEVQTGRGGRYASLPARVITPGVDTDAFAPDQSVRASARSQLGWTDDVPVVGFLGRLVEEKGVRTLLDALPVGSVPWRVLFVGDGPERQAIDAFARRHEGRVRIISHATHDDVPRWLNAMDVLCAPSRTTPAWREQFGRMLVEAMACGVPVVASDSGEIPHVVGDAGVIVPESATADWAATLETLLTDPVARADYAQRGRRRALDRYAWPIIARQHLDFFETLT
ncbi:MAG TPA: glycosyltransferase family 4 protein [Vicinamibacterales bacterium]|nr:glycosyltransferase family 4 protein [Vicinamibacterales bacterium]